MGDMFERQPERTKLFLQRVHKRTMRCLATALIANAAKAEHLRLLPAKIRQKFSTKFLDQVAAHLKEFVADDETPLETGWCYKHAKQCKVYPTVNPVHGQQFIALGAGGIVCLDWSARGSRAGTLGDGCFAFCSMMREIWVHEPDAVILECTREYDHQDIIHLLGEKYDLWPIIFSLSEVGVPSQRYRKYMIILLKTGLLKWKPGMEFTKPNFLKIFGRSLQCNGHVYMMTTPTNIVRDYIEKMAAQRGFPIRDGNGAHWNPEHLLTTGEKNRLRQYKTIAGSDADGEFFVDPGQNISHASITECVPALTRRCRPWSLALKRPMVIEERLEAQGFPAVLPETTLGLKLPWNDALPTMTERQLSSLAGNAMHFTAISTVMLYLLACTDVQP